MKLSRNQKILIKSLLDENFYILVELFEYLNSQKYLNNLKNSFSYFSHNQCYVKFSKKKTTLIKFGCISSGLIIFEGMSEKNCRWYTKIKFLNNMSDDEKNFYKRHKIDIKDLKELIDLYILTNNLKKL